VNVPALSILQARKINGEPNGEGSHKRNDTGHQKQQARRQWPRLLP